MKACFGRWSNAQKKCIEGMNILYARFWRLSPNCESCVNFTRILVFSYNICICYDLKCNWKSIFYWQALKAAAFKVQILKFGKSCIALFSGWFSWKRIALEMHNPGRHLTKILRSLESQRGLWLSFGLFFKNVVRHLWKGRKWRSPD